MWWAYIRGGLIFGMSFKSVSICGGLILGGLIFGMR